MFSFFVITNNLKYERLLQDSLYTSDRVFLSCKTGSGFLGHRIGRFDSKVVKEQESEKISRTTKLILASVEWKF